MADPINLIANAAADDADSLMLTKLANRMADRIPRLCELKTVYDGEELVPAQHVPSSMKNKPEAEIYKRNMGIASMNVARPMIDSVTVRQRPNGFRLINDATQRSVAADQMWRQCHMNIKARDLFHMRNLYGEAFILVSNGRGKDYVQLLSPWQCVMDADEDSAVIYAYDDTQKMNTLTLYRLQRDDTGVPTRVYSRIAVEKSDTRALLAETDEQSIYDLANGDSTTTYSFASDYQWQDDPETDWDYAFANGTLPIQRFATADHKGLFEAHLPSIYRIDQQVFDRVTITMMQAFIQRALKGIKRTQYAEGDPAVVAGEKKVGDPIDMSDLFRAAPGAAWVLPDGVDVWESKQVDLTPLSNIIKDDVKELADVAMTPLGINSNDTGGSASGADLKREGVVFKAEDLNERANDGLVSAMRMALYLDGNTEAADSTFETMWLPITPIQYADPAQSASQLKGILPDETIMTKVLGFNEQDVMEARRQADSDALSTMTGDEPVDGAAGLGENATGGTTGLDMIPPSDEETGSGAGPEAQTETTGNGGE